jgi:hypothetical protein
MNMLPRPAAVALLVLLVLPGSLLSQNRSDSPVFKQYRPPEEIPLLRQSDPVYQIWQAFLCARKANAGDPLAQHELGLRYLVGAGVERDTAKAAAWIGKAAAQNLIPARFNYAILTYNGWGIAWNPFEAYRNFLFCAEHDVAEAQFAVGISYAEGLVHEEDWEKGWSWIKKAAEGGYKPAEGALPIFEQNRAAATSPARQDSLIAPVTVTSFQPDAGMDSLSVIQEKSLLKNALLQADPQLRRALGLTRMMDSTSAVDSLDLEGIRRSADAGSPEALALLGRFAQQGLLTGRDSVASAAFYLRAFRSDSRRAGKLLWELAQANAFLAAVKARAEGGDSVAQFVWAGLTTLGMDASLLLAKAYITEQQALQLLRRSAGSGYVPATLELALCHYGGRWVPVDPERATALLREAASLGSQEAAIRLAVLEVRASTDTARQRELVGILWHGLHEGSLLAEVALGYCAETGRGMPPSTAVAARLYRSAWGRGSQDAYRALRRLHDALRPPDPEFALSD